MPTIDQLRALLEKEPDDPFLHYGLALALDGAGRREEALEALGRVHALDAHYVAGWYHKGRILVDLGREDEARETLRHGMEIARGAGDEHAAGEMEELLEGLDV